MEFVYVVPRSELFPDASPQGLVPFGPAYPAELFRERVARHGFFVERAAAERTPAWKQIIPYSVAFTPADGRVLLMRRLAAGGEARLHDKLSIGVGGHINPEDVEPAREPLLTGTHREIAEELLVEGSYRVAPVGLLNDDSNSVGAVHVGLVQILTIEGSVRIREEDVLEGRMATPRELADLRASGARFETWSSLLVDALDELLFQPLFALSATDTVVCQEP